MDGGERPKVSVGEKDCWSPADLTPRNCSTTDFMMPRNPPPPLELTTAMCSVSEGRMCFTMLANRRSWSDAFVPVNTTAVGISCAQRSVSTDAQRLAPGSAGRVSTKAQQSTTQRKRSTP